jgi:hypothetical protein
MKSLIRDQAGSVAVYAAMFSAVAVGGGVLAIDFGRAALLQTQMQDSADAAAMSGAFHLDGKEDARVRATNVALNAIRNRSNIPRDGNGTELSVAPAGIIFYSALKPTPVVATEDLDARFIKVGLVTKKVAHMFGPTLNVITKGNQTETSLTATSVASVSPYICNAPPLMMCDLAELDPGLDPTKKSNIGRQIRLKEPQAGGGAWVPGNFGLLSLPDGSSGASDLESALAAVEPADCYQLDVLTATGSKTVKVKDGINARFDISPLPDPPAPNVINYPRDVALIASADAKMGDGTWDIAGYWLAKHGAVVPPELAGATRYQTYLFELGETYGRNGRETVYPVPETGLPAGFVPVIPGAADIPVNAANPTLPDFDGVPQNAPAGNGPWRRLVQVALLQCVADGINGKGTYPTHGRYVELFITQEVRSPPNAAIYGEIVRSLSPLNDPEFHANVRLVE